VFGGELTMTFVNFWAFCAWEALTVPITLPSTTGSAHCCFNRDSSTTAITLPRSVVPVAVR